MITATPPADCGRLIHYDDAYYDEEEDDDGPYCYDCYDRRRDRHVIKNYYYKPVPLFYGKGPRYFGVELEIDNGGESDSNARAILERANVEGKEYAYVKHDGSLDDGFEIVTHPLSYNCHMNEFPWPDILEKAKAVWAISPIGPTPVVCTSMSARMRSGTPDLSRSPVSPVFCTSWRRTGRSC